MTHTTLLSGALLLCFLAACTGGTPTPAPSSGPNTLTDAERDDGWKLLFDGTSLEQWRGFRMDSMPAGWQAVDGAITRVSAGGDIITRNTFTDFELRLDWKVEPGGNSGIMYRVTEEDSSTYQTGPEMQVLDDSGHADGASRLTAAGSAYAIYGAPAGAVRPAGKWNEIRLIVDGSHVEHWLNGQKVVEYELGSPEWETLVANSKFNQWEGYGRAQSGHIALQDHGDRVSYRNIRIKVLP